jgi:hypothetical protein
MQRFRGLLAAVVLSSMFFVARADDAKKVVFVAGPKDHGRPGRHEYVKDMALLKSCLDNATNLKGLSTVMYTGQVPAISEVKDAAVIVVESSGDRVDKETHAIFPTDAKTDGVKYDGPAAQHMQELDGLMKKGTGLVVLHYATWVDNPMGRKYFLDWVGGFHEKDYSKVLVNKWSVAPTAARHPVLNGIKPWADFEDEFYISEYLPWDERRTPLLTAKLADGGVEDHTVAWAVQREGGGRGFVMTGVDYHKNMWLDQQRRFLANGIAWAAGLDVPAGGVSCPTPAPEPPADAAAIGSR